MEWKGECLLDNGKKAQRQPNGWPEKHPGL
jgi:hypothetical protein